MPKTKKIIITGTHLTPAIELINQLKKDTDSWEIFYIGRNYNSHQNLSPSIESVAIPKLNIKFFGFDSGKLDRRWLPNTLAGIPLTIKSLFKIYKLIAQIKPDVVVSFGGYISVPVIFNSYLQKIPSITHEQTSTLSLSTKINSKFTNKVALSFPTNLKNDKYVVTGNLLRRQIFENKSKYFQNLKIKLPIIYITGGNQGSTILNQSIIKILPTLTKNYFIIHQTGNQTDNNLKLNNYLPVNYIDDIGWVLNNANIIISRAGANTCQEIMALNKKSILIPLKVSQQDEQNKNANLVLHKLPSQTIIISESELNPNSLLNSINKLIKIKSLNNKSFSINYDLLNLIKTL
jgi:UDP-N-acetylglucosamine--N-acetylmuramyl-(pentapeptide) pyrophosphoryl-undecaprenol N-acetylglucosamine transferase